jgi:hypothetical protein
MKMNSQLTKIVIYQHVGFLCIIALCFLDELLKLPTLIFSDDPFAFIFRRSTIEMLLILGVWLLVSNSTRRVLERMQYLEKFMRVCAWCRRINYQGDWIPLEEFMRQGFDTPTTHGICTACFRQQQEAILRAKLARQKKAEAG